MIELVLRWGERGGGENLPANKMEGDSLLVLCCDNELESDDQ